MSKQTEHLVELLGNHDGWQPPITGMQTLTQLIDLSRRIDALEMPPGTMFIPPHHKDVHVTAKEIEELKADMQKQRGIVVPHPRFEIYENEARKQLTAEIRLSTDEEWIALIENERLTSISPVVHEVLRRILQTIRNRRQRQTVQTQPGTPGVS